jgi:hypothetical protein
LLNRYNIYILGIYTSTENKNIQAYLTDHVGICRVQKYTGASIVTI